MNIRTNKKKLLFFMLLVGMLCCMYSGTVSAANMIKRATEVSGGKWEKTSAGRRYQYADGSFIKNEWIRIGSKVYCINSEGYAETGWFSYKGNRYYANKNTGRVYNDEWKRTSKASYYLKPSGVKAVNTWRTIDGKKYYFGGSGKLICDTLIKIGNKFYCTDADGVCITSSFVTKNNITYYFNSRGVRIEGKWKKINKKYYYFDEYGEMQKNKWIGDYYVGDTGERLTNCEVDGYYLDSEGKKTEMPAETATAHIFMGDSRMVGMSSVVSASDTFFIGKTSMGYSWLESTASTELASCLALYSRAKVIMAFGINDLYNISNYIDYYNTLIKKYPSANFYFMSVLPVDEAKEQQYGYTVTNSEIKSFNNQLRNAFPTSYLDVYSYLESDGFSTSDGIHYTNSTYQKIYDYVISLIG